jgi:hypothetical protein
VVLVAAVGIDGEGIKHPLGLMEECDRERLGGPGAD